jgi:hypothetical protein
MPGDRSRAQHDRVMPLLGATFFVYFLNKIRMNIVGEVPAAQTNWEVNDGRRPLG